MSISEIVALASVVISIGTNVALYIHLSSVTNTRFDIITNKMELRFVSVERCLEMIQGSLHEMDVRLTKLNG